MKLIIDIPEKDFHRICQDYISFSNTLECRGLSAIAEGTPIPDNATNGEWRMTKKFTEELQVLLNKNGIDTICNTPDYILAEYLTSCLETYANTVQSRDTWFGFKPFSRCWVEPQKRSK